MTSKLYEIIECAFSETRFEEALIEAISDLIDYDAAAEMLIEDMREDISAAVTDIAKAVFVRRA